MRLPLVLLALALVGSACRCDPGLASAGADDLVVTPSTLTFAPTVVGVTASASIEVTNRGRSTAFSEVTVDPPFFAAQRKLVVGGAATERVTVHFSPRSAGHFVAVMHIDTVEVLVEGDGLEVAACVPSDVCVTSTFDGDTARCVEAPRPDGIDCHSSCVTRGSCRSGRCIGEFVTCDDGDACTVDGCGAQGCSHVPRECDAPSTPCRVARCDAARGCLVEDAVDGTLCGVDDCTDLEVDVCIVGHCVRRPRQPSGRCTNTWVPRSIPARSNFAMAYDEARRRVVVFDGALRADTWEWDGSDWMLRTPPVSPPARTYVTMAYDAARARVVLFGGYDGTANLSDTWEWDGTTWLQKTPPTSPSARSGHAMTYDPTRRRVVIIGPYDSPSSSDSWEFDGHTWVKRVAAPLPITNQSAIAYDSARQRLVVFDRDTPQHDTWEWDGTEWSRHSPAKGPATSHAALVYDAARQRVVLFGGYGYATLAETWEWDGEQWLKRSPPHSPPARAEHALTYDSARRRVVLFGGRTNTGDFSDVWEWDGTEWEQRTPVASPGMRFNHGMSADSVRKRVVVFGGGFWAENTWEWHGRNWEELKPSPSPHPRFGQAMAFDAKRARVVLFGGEEVQSPFGFLLADTWTWDGQAWQQRAPDRAPSARAGAAVAYDETRQRVVLFGGFAQQSLRTALGDTWLWDGSTWYQPTVGVSPAARGSHSMAYDAARARVVLFGGFDNSDHVFDETWEWEGSTWMLRTPPSKPPATHGAAMSFDRETNQVLLFGGASGGVEQNTTWEWDGVSWSQRQPAASPPRRADATIAFDENRRHVVLFGGGFNSDTWEWLP